MTTPTSTSDLPRWSVADVHESLEARSFTDAMEQMGAEVDRLVTLFDELGIRATPERSPNEADGEAANAAIQSYNRTSDESDLLETYIYATVATDSRDELGQALLSEMQPIDAKLRPLTARLADWVASLGVEALAQVSTEVHDHVGP
ncbi:MAG: hypothetical protein DRJ50_09855, partial [Actinobacteria bacterium]